MDLQKEREAFEAYMAEKYKNLMDRRQCRNNGGGYMSWDMNVAWQVWQAAKAQAVPEWAVIVPKLSANYLFNTVPELGFEHQDQKDTVLYHLNYMASEFRDSAKQFVEDDHAKQKTMIEAQEQANDL